MCYTRRVSSLFRFAILGALACGSESASVSVTTGGESDALTKSPPVTSLLIEAVDRTGARTTLAQSPYPTTSAIDLGTPSQSLVASLQLTGMDASNNAVVFGAAPFAELGVFNGTTVPLFVQRKGELARMPGATADARSAPLLQITARGAYFAGGTIAGSTTPPVTGAYDLLALNGFATTFAANRTALSFAIIQLAQATNDGDLALALLVDDAGVDLVGLATAELYPTSSLPSNMSWSDIAGGQTVVSSDDGTVYILGQSKTDAPSRMTLRFPSSVNGTSVSGGLRQGAAVAWSEGQHAVFVYGGSAIEPGAELVSQTAMPTHYLDPDPAMGLAAVAFDPTGTTMLVAGDGDFAHLIDLSCTAACHKVAWGTAKPPALKAAALFALGTGAFLLVGDDPSTGATEVYRMTATSVDPVPLRIARTGARAIQTQTGSIILFGGGSATPESYVE